MPRAFAFLIVAYLFALVLSLSRNTYALPEYGVRYGQSCQLCHYSVSGGGSRNLYGAQFFSYTDLPANPLDFGEIASVNPMVNDRLQIGFDLRSFYYMKQYEGDIPDENSFVTMQGDLYLNYQVGDRTVVILDRGLRSTFEAYVQTQALPYEMALKFGRFMPNFGWRFVDHTAHVRRFTGFGGVQGVGGEEDGFEIGHYNERQELSLALTNGRVPSPVDIDQGKTLTARVAKRFHLNQLGLSLGGSYRYSELGNTGTHLRMGGLFYGLNLGRFTFLGETDLLLDTGSGYASSHLLRYDLKPGLASVTAFDFHDPDVDLASGSNMRLRTGFDYTPYGYVTFSPLIEYTEDAGVKGISAQLHLHVWY